MNEDSPVQEALSQLTAIEKSNRRPVGIYFGRPWFERLVHEVYPPQDETSWMYASDPIAQYARRRHEENAAQRETALARWDREGTSLFGMPMHPRSAMGNEVEVR